MQSSTSDQVQACANMGNLYPFCSPVSTDVWVNGSTHDFIWNFNDPYYVGYETLNLYLYYFIKYQYVSVKNYTNLERASGYEEVKVDNSWFLSSLPNGSPPQNLTMLGFYLPGNYSPYTEISSPTSMFPRPFNFTVTQFATNNTNANGNSIANGTVSGGSNSNHSNNSNSDNSTTSSGSSNTSNLPGWAIAVIVIAVIAFICGATALIWTTMISRRNKRSNKLIPIAGGAGGRDNSNESNKHNRNYKDNASINSQTKVNAFRSTDSVPMTASSVGTLTSKHTYAQPLSPSYDKVGPSDAVLLADSFRNAMGRPNNDCNIAGGEEEEELKRRRLGEALLQRQLEEDGTSVKHAGRFTRVKSIADIQKSAVFEHPKY